MATETCPLCESGTIVDRDTRLTRPYRNLASLTAAHDVSVPTCDSCGEQFFDRRTAEALKVALEAAFAERQRAIVARALPAITKWAPQREWERRLDLSAGYLSRLKSGKESSVALVTLLGVVARAPAEWADRIEDLWQTGGECRRRDTSVSGFRWFASNTTTLAIVASPLKDPPAGARATQFESNETFTYGNQRDAA